MDHYKINLALVLSYYTIVKSTLINIYLWIMIGLFFALLSGYFEKNSKYIYLLEFNQILVFKIAKYHKNKYIYRAQ